MQVVTLSWELIFDAYFLPQLPTDSRPRPAPPVSESPADVYTGSFTWGAIP
jgi:hypothetical protein